MLYKIITPNPTFTGERAGVTFIAGIAYTSDATAAEELRAMGYIVTRLAADLTGGVVDPTSSEVLQAPPVKPSTRPHRRKATQEHT